MTVFSFLFGALLLNFSADEKPIKPSNTKQGTITVSDLQGLWLHSELSQNFENCSGFTGETIPTPLYGTPDLYIENDTLWTLRYPCRMDEKTYFRIQADSLYIHENTVPFGYLRLNNNILSVTFPNCIRHFFEKSTADSETIHILKKDTIHGACLLGKYKIITHFEPGDEEPFDYIAPVKMPTCLKISPKQLGAAKQRMITLKVDNKDRLFYIHQIDFNGYYPNVKIRFILYPAAWWKGDFFDVFYSQE